MALMDTAWKGSFMWIEMKKGSGKPNTHSVQSNCVCGSVLVKGGLLWTGRPYMAHRGKCVNGEWWIRAFLFDLEQMTKWWIQGCGRELGIEGVLKAVLHYLRSEYPLWLFVWVCSWRWATNAVWTSAVLSTVSHKG